MEKIFMWIQLINYFSMEPLSLFIINKINQIINEETNTTNNISQTQKIDSTIINQKKLKTSIDTKESNIIKVRNSSNSESTSTQLMK